MTQVSASAQMERLETARTKVDELTRKKERLSGELSAKQKLLGELETRAKEEFECEVAEIPDLVESLDKEANEALAKAEALLGIGSSTTEDQSADAEEDEDALV